MILEDRLVQLPPRKRRDLTRALAILFEAFEEVRYSSHSAITTEELDWLTERIGILQRIVHDVRQEHLGARPAIS